MKILQSLPTKVGLYNKNKHILTFKAEDFSSAFFILKNKIIEMILYKQNVPDSSLISYYDLTDKPFINGVMLDGSLSLKDLGISGGVTSVNGQTGDVIIKVKDIDLTDYVKTEDLAPIDRKITTLESNVKTISDSSVNYYTKSQIDAKKYLTEVPSNYVTTTMLNTTTNAINSSINALDNKIKTISDSSVNYYTKNEVGNLLNEKVSGNQNVSLPRIERIAALTPTEYEAITPDENTLYLIK